MVTAVESQEFGQFFISHSLNLFYKTWYVYNSLQVCRNSSQCEAVIQIQFANDLLQS